MKTEHLAEEVKFLAEQGIQTVPPELKDVEDKKAVSPDDKGMFHTLADALANGHLAYIDSKTNQFVFYTPEHNQFISERFDQERVLKSLESGEYGESQIYYYDYSPQVTTGLSEGEYIALKNIHAMATANIPPEVERFSPAYGEMDVHYPQFGYIPDIKRPSYRLYRRFATQLWNEHGTGRLHRHHWRMTNTSDAKERKIVFDTIERMKETKIQLFTHQPNVRGFLAILRKMALAYAKDDEIHFRVLFSAPIHIRGLNNFSFSLPWARVRTTRDELKGDINNIGNLLTQMESNMQAGDSESSIAIQDEVKRYGGVIDQVDLGVLLQFPIMILIKHKNPEYSGGAYERSIDQIKENRDETVDVLSDPKEIDLVGYLNGKETIVPIIDNDDSPFELFKKGLSESESKIRESKYVTESEMGIPGSMDESDAKLNCIRTLYNRFHVFSTSSSKSRRRRNNCWFDCLEIAGVPGIKIESPMRLRKIVGLNKKEKKKNVLMDVHSFQTIAQKYQFNLVVVNKNCIDMSDKLTDWKKVLSKPRLLRWLRIHYNVIFVLLDDNMHYSLIQVLAYVNECRICKQPLKTIRGLKHKCNFDKMRYREKKILIYKYNYTLATYDIETRVDQSSYIQTLIPDLESKDVFVESDSVLKHKNRVLKHSAVVPIQINIAVRDCKDYVLPERGFGREGFTGLDCIQQFLYWLVDEHKVNRHYHFRAHNASRFDAFFLLGYIERDPRLQLYLNEQSKCIKQTQILKFQFAGHEFCDSYQFLSSSLAKLCANFNLDKKLRKRDEVKIEGRPEFKKPMDLILCNPEMSPYEYIQWLKKPEQKEVLHEMREYCYFDCVSLLNILIKFEELVLSIILKMNKLKKFNIWHSITLPALSLRIFKTHWSKKKNPIQKACGELVDHLSRSVIGGISDVVYPGRHSGQIALIDVVSLYSSAMLLFTYPYHANGEFKDYDVHVREKEDLPDGWHGWIETWNYSHDLLKYHGVWTVYNIKMGKDLDDKSELKISCVPGMSDDKRRDWHAKEFRGEMNLLNLDMLNILEHGGSFEVLRGYIWTKSWSPFIPVISPFVTEKMEQDIIQLRDPEKYNVALRNTCKLQSNSLFGKLTQRSEYVRYVRYNSFSDIPMEILENAAPSDIFQCNNGWYVRSLDDEAKDGTFLYFGTFILGYSRIMMQSYFDRIGRKNVIASETDSIYCPLSALQNLNFPSNSAGYLKHFLSAPYSSRFAVDNVNEIFKIGKSPGNMNVEFGEKDFITNCYFLRKKCYFIEFAFDIEKNEEVEVFKMRAKGIPGRNLEPELYRKLYSMNICPRGQEMLDKKQLRKLIVRDILHFERHLYRPRLNPKSMMRALFRTWTNPFHEVQSSPLDVCLNRTMITHVQTTKFFSPDSRGYRWFQWLNQSFMIEYENEIVGF
jgi:hypothetical protein